MHHKKTGYRKLIESWIGGVNIYSYFVGEQEVSDGLRRDHKDAQNAVSLEGLFEHEKARPSGASIQASGAAEV